MAILNKWFCCQLHTAAVVIGWIEAVGCLIATIVLGILLGSLDSIAELFERMINERELSNSQTDAAAYFIKMGRTLIYMLKSNNLFLFFPI